MIGEKAENLFHDYVGWIMMIFALAMLWAEMKLLAALLIKPSEAPLILTEPRLGSGKEARLKRCAGKRLQAIGPCKRPFRFCLFRAIQFMNSCER